MNSDCIIHHWLLDSTSGSLIHESTGEQRRLGEYQLRLLQILIEHAGKILTREELNNLVWERRVIGNNSLPNAIHALRVALDDNGKHQKIIKTIPKKGYILEVEFCQFVPESSTKENSLPLPVNDVATEATTVPQRHNEQFHGSVNSHLWRWLALAQVVLLLTLLGIIANYLFPSSHSELIEKNTVAYSNIRLMELRRGWDSASASDDLYKELTPMLFALNQSLKERQVKMNVFFFSSGSSLNYTLSLKSKCDQKQLAMNIINWRTDGAQLSALIYRESERKINEMANCVN